MGKAFSLVLGGLAQVQPIQLYYFCYIIYDSLPVTDLMNDFFLITVKISSRVFLYTQH